MYPIEFEHIQTLVRFIVHQVVGRFLSTFQILSDTKKVYYSEFLEYVTPIIVERIASNWNDVTTAHQAENQIEDMYNAARTELVQLLNLHGGTVEFGPGDVQPLTDQRLGQSEAWDEWCARMNETNWGQPEGWYFNDEHWSDDLEDFLDQYFMKRYIEVHDCEVTLRKANEEVQAWTYTTFTAYYNTLPDGLDSPRQLEYRIDDPDGTPRWYPLPNEFTSDHDDVLTALYERERFRGFHRNIDHRYLRMIPRD